tara:strand:+ start:2057 stop:2647 length:591 start_codon:yes stop_codon:yes gene_type:complete
MFGCEYTTQNVPAKYHEGFPDKIVVGKTIPEFVKNVGSEGPTAEPIEYTKIDFYNIMKRGVLSVGKYEEVPPVITHSLYFFTETETELQNTIDTIGDLENVNDHFKGTGTTLRKFQVSEPLMKRILTMMFVGKKTSLTPVIKNIQDLDSHSAYLNPVFPSDTIVTTKDCPFYWNECAVWDIMKPIWNDHLAKWPIQ